MENIYIPLKQWRILFKGLRKRGKGVRESGAFLLAKPNSLRIHKIVFYNEFDKNVSDTGIIQFKGAVKFFKYLADNNLCVIADIHTHPGKSTQQSESDQTHPMIRTKGHIAIIAPYYGEVRFIRPTDCSVYKYLGEYHWEKFSKLNNPLKLKLI